MQYHAMALLLNFETFSQNCVLIPEIMFYPCSVTYVVWFIVHNPFTLCQTYAFGVYFICIWNLSTQLYLTQLKLPRFGILIEGNTILLACWPLNMWCLVSPFWFPLMTWIDIVKASSSMLACGGMLYWTPPSQHSC